MFVMDSMSTTMTTTSSTPITGAGIAVMIIMVILYFGFFGLMIAAMWRLFKKANQPGWASIVPLYNIYVLVKLVGRPDWFLLLFLVPFVNIVAIGMLSFDIAKAYGKSPLFGFFGLILFAPIGYMILGFGSATYVGPLQAGTGPIMPNLAPMPPVAAAQPLPVAPEVAAAQPAVMPVPVAPVVPMPVAPTPPTAPPTTPTS